jgi:hypothetical protein
MTVLGVSQRALTMRSSKQDSGQLVRAISCLLIALMEAMGMQSSKKAAKRPIMNLIVIDDLVVLLLSGIPSTLSVSSNGGFQFVKVIPGGTEHINNHLVVWQDACT